MNLEIKNIKGLKFSDKNGYYMASKNTYAFKTEKGYYSMDGKFPYSPAGGKRSLQEIIDCGGFTDYDNVKWIVPSN